MKYDVVAETALAELVAAVRAKMPIGGVARAWIGVQGNCRGSDA